MDRAQRLGPCFANIAVWPTLEAVAKIEPDELIGCCQSKCTWPRVAMGLPNFLGIFGSKPQVSAKGLIEATGLTASIG